MPTDDQVNYAGWAPSWTYPPDEVVIGPHPYRVERVIDSGTGLARQARPNEVGHTDMGRNKMTIRSDGSQAPMQERDTLLHEVVHAVLWQAGLDEEHDVFKTDRMAERVVDVLATSLLDVLRRNPTLVDYLLGGTTMTRQAIRQPIIDDIGSTWDQLEIALQNLDTNYVGQEGRGAAADIRTKALGVVRSLRPVYDRG